MATKASAAIVWRELRNRWGVYLGVRMRGLGRRFRAGELAAEIAAIERRGRFAALWGFENLGYRYAESERRRGADPRELFDPRRTGALPERALPMLHAGVGLSLARYALARAAGSTTEAAKESAAPRPAEPSADPFPRSGRGAAPKPADPFLNPLAESADPSSDPFSGRDYGAAALAVVGLLEDISLSGQATAAVECLGLITRFFHPRRLVAVANRLAAEAPQAVEPFWHGVGRCVYFLPAEMMPHRCHWRRLLDRLSIEVPPGVPRTNALAGLAWALVLVNQRHPAILEELLRRHGTRLLVAARPASGNEAGAGDAFASGVASACAVRELISPGHAVTRTFLSHRPVDSAVAAVWDELVAGPGRWGLERLLPRLVAANRVSELCRYQPLETCGERRSSRGLSWVRIR